MEEIRYGIEECLDVSWYAKPEFNEEQMFQIMFGLEDKLNVLLFARNEFNVFSKWHK